MKTKLETARLVLRPWRLDEAERLLDIRSREEVAKWLGDPEPWPNLATASQRINKWLAQSVDKTPFGVWAIVPTGTGVPAGSVSMNKLPTFRDMGGDFGTVGEDNPTLDWRDDEVEVGWYLHPDSVGKGYASEAARRVMDYASSCPVPPPLAIMWPHNEASAGVAQAIGMGDLGLPVDPWYGTPETPHSRIFRALA